MTATIELTGFTYRDHSAGEEPLVTWHRTLACTVCQNVIGFKLSGDHEADAHRTQAEIAGHRHAPPGCGWNGLPLRALSVNTFAAWLTYQVAHWRDMPLAEIADPQLLPIIRALAEIMDSRCDEADILVGEVVGRQCPVCQTTTYTLEHVERGWCAYCRAFTSEPLDSPAPAGGRITTVTLEQLAEHEGILPGGAVGIRWMSHEQCPEHARERLERTIKVLGPDASGVVLYQDTLVGPLQCADCTAERPIIAELPVNGGRPPSSS